MRITYFLILIFFDDRWLFFDNFSSSGTPRVLILLAFFFFKGFVILFLHYFLFKYIDIISMKRPQSEMQHKGASQRKYEKKLLILTTILVLVEFVSSFSTPTNPLQLAQHSRTSRYISRPLTVLSVASTEILPELGRDGVYHITNPEQHKYVLFWKFKLPPYSFQFPQLSIPPLFFSFPQSLDRSKSRQINGNESFCTMV